MRRARQSNDGDRDNDRSRERHSTGDKRRKPEPFRSSTSHGYHNSRDKNNERGYNHHRGGSHNHSVSSTKSNNLRNNSSNQYQHRRVSPVQNRSRSTGGDARGSGGKFSSSPAQRSPPPRTFNVDHRDRSQQSARDCRDHHSNQHERNHFRSPPWTMKDRGREDDRKNKISHPRRLSPVPVQSRSRSAGVRGAVRKFVSTPTKRLLSSPRKPYVDHRNQETSRATTIPQRNQINHRPGNFRAPMKDGRREVDRKRGLVVATGSRSKLPLSVSARARNKLSLSASSRNKLPLSGSSKKLHVAVSGSSRRKLTVAVSGKSRNTSGIPSASTTSPKLTLEELHCDNNNADDYDELTQVDKWVRSAPDELYYMRQMDGHAVATERTQTLCEKFKATLLTKSKSAREEAEVLGAVKMRELIEIENVYLVEQRKLKKISKSKRKCCHDVNACKKKINAQGDCLSIENSSSSSSPLPDLASTNGSSVQALQSGHIEKPTKIKDKQSLEVITKPSVHPKVGEKLHNGLLEQGELIESDNEKLQEGGNGSTSKVIGKSMEVDECPSEMSSIINNSSPHSPKLSQNNKISTSDDNKEDESMEEGELADSSDGEDQSCLKPSKPSKELTAPDAKTEKILSISVAKPTLKSSSDADSQPKAITATPAPAVASTSKMRQPCCNKKEESGKKEEQKTKQKVLKKKKPNSTKKTSSSESENKEASNASDEDKSSSSSSDADEEETGSSSSSSDSEGGFSMTRSDTANRELERRKKHPRRLHDELWHNDPGLMNDGPVCRCSAKARRFGIRHGFYPGEEKIEPCDPFTNNKNKLYHYRITISPPKNFLISTPTVINHDGHEYIFEGFSIFSHYQLDLTLPPCKVIRFNIRYDVFVEEERFPESFCVKELHLFETYLFREILELVDLKYDWTEECGCSQFHLMPRFVRQLPDNGQEILSMSRVIIHLLKSDKELVKEEDLSKLYTVEQSEWQNFADRHKGTIVTKWGMKPCAIRVDQIDRDVSGREVMEDDGIPFPLIVHFGIRPPQLSYAGNAGYQRAWRRYVKYRHLLSNMPKPSQEDKSKLLKKEMKLQAMRTASNMKRDVTVAISSKGFRTTGICCDLVQHAMLIPVLVAHLRFHKCLETLERSMAYIFRNRYLLQLAMTHPSYRENFGTNPDHARNALTNCGIRQPEYGDRRIHYASTRKRGINTLINIMAKFGADQETESDITHNERLEFLGDAVVEFVTSIHLFHIFPDLEEGGLATYRAAIVQNQHLAVLAQTLGLDQFMLYAHGSDLCHDSELRHAMANCFEALMGALFLDGSIEAADRVFGNTLFGTSGGLLNLWTNYPKHPLQQEEPEGDRDWIKDYDVLKRLAEFESSIGVEFRHIRLLARAFTDRSLGYNNLTRGSNQRLEFLGDTVLQLISSEYLYRHFPDHHEGHLSLLRSSLVNNRTQSLVCDDLGMFLYAMRGDPKSEMKTKDRADLLEAFLGALYIDKGLSFCIRFCQVCFFPRLSKSITKQEWNDPKSKLQQCCLTLRQMNGREPDIPMYKVTESLGPTNTRTYIVAVYFRGTRLATAQGHSIQEAEMNAAALAIESSAHLFPQLYHQKRIMDKTKSCN